MRARGRTARRLAAASLLALALLAAGVGGWGQPVAPSSAFGYFPPSGGLAPGGEVPARLPGGTGGGAADATAGAAAVGAIRVPIGVVGYKPAVVARLDPRTLRPLPGPRIELPFGVSGYGWSPDGSRLVLGDLDDDALHVVDPVRLRRLATIRFGIVAEAPQQLAWLGPRRVAVVAGNPGDGATLVLADPVAGRVLSRRPLAPAGIVAAGAGDRLVLLRTPIDRIGPARLSVVDHRGRIETVQLTGVLAGFQSPPDWDQPGAYGITRDAALAVDPTGGRAFVVAAGPTVAEVDLAGLQVTYRRLRQPSSLLRRLAHWLVPPAEAKQVAGTWRSACWLGGGTLAVWGGDSSVTGDTPETQRMDQEPSGLKLVDTRAWTVRPLDPAAPNASWQAGRLLAYGRTWDDEAEHERGTGLTVHGPGWARHLLGTRSVDDAYLNGDLVYASVDNGGDQLGRVVVSLRSGRVVASSDEPLPYLLLGDPGPGC
jgi:hypothetical protein